MITINGLKDTVLAGGQITRDEALWLYAQPLEELSPAADGIRKYFCGDGCDLCAIINARSGRCPENCRFCAQSAHHKSKINIYPLLSVQEILDEAKHNDQQGVMRLGIVTSGKRLSEEEVDQICEAIRAIRAQTNISVCGSLGLLSAAQFAKLKEAGLHRVHNNLETSRRFFPYICTTHSYDDKIAAIRAAKSVGLSICSGGIVGLGETIEDRIDLALALRELEIKSVPVNMLNPIPGTPLERNQVLTMDDMKRIFAVFRFILPDAALRLCGGRGLMQDKGRGCFAAGANAAITGDMLTTAGISVEKDLKMLGELGFKVRLGKD